MDNVTLQNFTDNTIEQIGLYPQMPWLRLETSVLTFVIGIFAVVLNSLAITAICRIRTVLPGNIRLVCCLACFDLLISLVMVIESSFSFAYYTSSSSVRNHVIITGKNISLTLSGYHPCYALAMHTLRYIGYNGTLLTLAALSTDLYIAIMQPLNYSRVMRRSRINLLLSLVIISAVALGACQLYLPISSSTLYLNLPSSHRIPKFQSYCFRRWYYHMKSSLFTFGVILLTVVMVSVVYSRVFYEINKFSRHHHTKHHNHNQQQKQLQHNPRIPPIINSNNCKSHKRTNCQKNKPMRISSNASLKRNQRGLATTLILLVVFLICFLPSFLIEIYLLIELKRGIAVKRREISMSKLFMNLTLICTVLDPLLYSFRLKDIKNSTSRILLWIFHHKSVSKRPPILKGRARLPPLVPVYQKVSSNPQPTIHRRSIASSTPHSIIPNDYNRHKYPHHTSKLPESNKYQEHNRVDMSIVPDTNCKRKITPYSAPPYNKENNDQFISPPNLIWYPWLVANNNLTDTWNILKSSHRNSIQKLTRLSYDSRVNSKSTNSRSGYYHNSLQTSSTQRSNSCGRHSYSVESSNTNSTVLSRCGSDNNSNKYNGDFNNINQSRQFVYFMQNIVQNYQQTFDKSSNCVLQQSDF